MLENQLITPHITNPHKSHCSSHYQLKIPESGVSQQQAVIKRFSESKLPDQGHVLSLKQRNVPPHPPQPLRALTTRQVSNLIILTVSK